MRRDVAVKCHLELLAHEKRPRISRHRRLPPIELSEGRESLCITFAKTYSRIPALSSARETECTQTFSRLSYPSNVSRLTFREDTRIHTLHTHIQGIRRFHPSMLLDVRKCASAYISGDNTLAARLLRGQSCREIYKKREVAVPHCVIAHRDTDRGQVFFFFFFFSFFSVETGVSLLIVSENSFSRHARQCVV